MLVMPFLVKGGRNIAANFGLEIVIITTASGLPLQHRILLSSPLEQGRTDSDLWMPVRRNAASLDRWHASARNPGSAASMPQRDPWLAGVICRNEAGSGIHSENIWFFCLLTRMYRSPDTTFICAAVIKLGNVNSAQNDWIFLMWLDYQKYGSCLNV